MRNLWVIQIFLFVLVISSVTDAEEAEKVDLCLRFEKGQVVQYTRTVVSKSNQWSDLEEEEIVSDTTSVCTLEVLDVDEEGTASIKVTSDREVYSWKDLHRTLEYDSDTMPIKQAPWSILPMAAVVGRSFTVTVSSQGEVLEIDEGDRLREAVVDALKTKGARAQTIEWGKHLYTDEALERLMVSLIFAEGLYRREPVDLGDSWTVEGISDSGRTSTLLSKNTYTLAAYEKGLITVHREGVLESDPDGKPNPPNVRTVFRGKQESAYQVDEKTGWLVGMQSKLDLEGEYLVRETLEAEEETSTPTTVETTINLKVEWKAQTAQME